MAFTTVADLIIPTRFDQFVVERTAELSALFTSGIVVRDPRLQPSINNVGQVGNMPFFQDLTGNSQGVNTQSGIVSDIITTEQDIYVAHYRANAWGVEDIGSLIIGNDNPDPLDVIVDLVATWWARDRQDMLIATLAGVFLASDSSMDASKTDISTGDQANVVDANRFTATTFADATQLLGDAKTKLSGILVHSAVESDLMKNNLIDFIPDSEGLLTIPTFKGLRVIVDDGAPQTAITGGFKYISYIFGRGAIIENVSNGPKETGKLDAGTGTWMAEFSREAADGITRFFTRQKFLLHPSGVKYTSASQASTTPTDVELATGTNWARVFERKNVPIVQFTHNVAS